MKNFTFILLCLLIASCDEHLKEITPDHINPAVSTERKFNPNAGGANGNGNGGSTGTTTEWQQFEVYSGDWKVTYDTTWCGWLVMRWFDQNRPASGNGIEVSPYKMVVEPRVDPYNVECLTNVMPYRYGTNNLFKPSTTYSVRVAWTITDNNAKVRTIYYSDAVTVHTGINTCL